MASRFGSLPPFRRGAFALFLVTAVVSALFADQPAVADQLLLLPGNVLRGISVWTPVTANFMYPEGALMGLLGTAVIQWFFASELEAFWGTKKYLLLVIGAGIAGHLASVLVATFSPTVAVTPLGGAHAIDVAAATAFGVVFANRPLQLLAAIPLKGKGLAALIVGFSLLSPLARGAWPQVIPLVVAALVALAVTTQPWRRLRDSGKLGSKKPKKRHLRVVRPDSELLN